jgi:lipopolysaccharide/colanic/teichoic acid biosynthesis glycosyltransferase
MEHIHPTGDPWRSDLAYRATKRTLDVTVSLLALTLLAPVMAIVAVAIWLDDRRAPILFRQRRCGLHGAPLQVLKFRTMVSNADELKEQLRCQSVVPWPDFRLVNDPRVTRVGRLLRKTSLDELPQLLNVLRGDMSLVGPRPCIPYETEHFQAHHFERFLVPAGITGLWQVAARARSTFGEALDMDVAYARGWSLGLDLKLLFRTPFELMRSRTTA